MPSKHIPEQRQPMLDVLAVLQPHTTHSPPAHEPARLLHSSHSSLQLRPNNANRQVLASISEAFIIGPSWLVVTCLVVEQLPSNAVRHPLVA